MIDRRKKCRFLSCLRGRHIGVWGLLLVMAFPLFAGVSCNGEACLENKSSLFNVFFYSYGDSAVQVIVDSVSIYGIGPDSDLLLVDTSNISTFQATLRNDCDTTQYVLCYDQYDLNPRYKRDTLTFVCHSYIQFESAECGVMYNYVVDDFLYTRWQIVDAELLTPEINNQDVENIRLYYYVAE